MEEEKKETRIGRTVLIKGNLSGEEALVVEGKIEGIIKLTDNLIIENSGIIKADSNINNAVISGCVIGNTEAKEKVEITPTGRVLGDIKSPRVVIKEGASFKGMIDMGEFETTEGSVEFQALGYERYPIGKEEEAMKMTDTKELKIEEKVGTERSTQKRRR